MEIAYLTIVLWPTSSYLHNMTYSQFDHFRLLASVAKFRYIAVSEFLRTVICVGYKIYHIICNSLLKLLVSTLLILIEERVRHVHTLIGISAHVVPLGRVGIRQEEISSSMAHAAPTSVEYLKSRISRTPKILRHSQCFIKRLPWSRLFVCVYKEFELHGCCINFVHRDLPHVATKTETALKKLERDLKNYLVNVFLVSYRALEKGCLLLLNRNLFEWVSHWFSFLNDWSWYLLVPISKNLNSWTLRWTRRIGEFSPELMH